MEKKKGNRRSPSLFGFESRSEVWLAMMATIISFCALFTSVYQTIIQRKQQYASVWPYIMIATTNTHPSGEAQKPYFRFEVSNKGIGPAIITGVDYAYKGKIVHSEGDLVRLIFKETGYYVVSNLWDGRVISPNEMVNNIVFENEDSRKLDSLSQFVGIRLRYKSVYGEQWETRYNIPNEPMVEMLEE